MASNLVPCPRCGKDVGVTGFGRCSLCGAILTQARPTQAPITGMAVLRVASTLCALLLVAVGGIGVYRGSPGGVVALLCGLGALGFLGARRRG